MKKNTTHNKKLSSLERGMRGVSQSPHHLLWTVFFITLISLNSCKKQEVGPQCPTCEEEIKPTTTDVLIGCEGNFGWGNASLSSYNPLTQNVSNQVFQNINGFGLGDVLQDISEANGKLYITINNSGKIVILDTANYTFLGEITGLTSPRYFKALNGSVGYVSDLYSNSVQVIDLSSQTISGNIPTQRWTEHLLIHNNYVYAEAPDTNWIFVINTNNNLIEDTIMVGFSPNGLVLDKNENIWSLSTGGFNQELASLKCINPLTHQVTKTILFNSLTESPSQLRIDAAGGQLYFLNDGLQTISIDDFSIPLGKNIATNGSVFYGMNVDQNTKEIYITDAVDYVQQGKVYRYDSIFQPLDTFTVGIIPQSIWFK